MPSDPFITDMDPVQKMWLYEHWIGDQRDDAELAKNHAYLLGSFSNPEAVKQMMNDNIHESSDADYEESLKMVTNAHIKLMEIEQAPKIPVRKRRSRKLISQPKG